MLNNPLPPSNIELLRGNLKWTFLVPHGKSPYYDSVYINTFCIKSESVAYVQHVRRLDGKTGVRFLKMKKKSKLIQIIHCGLICFFWLFFSLDNFFTEIILSRQLDLD